jgi:tripartite-type tricarboxylate transporter receptor subunit TctC
MNRASYAHDTGRSGDQIAGCLGRRHRCAGEQLSVLIDYAKANPGKLSIGQTGVGSMSHVAYELLQQKAGIKPNGVPYKGGAPMVTDLLGGHLPLASDLLSNFIQLAKEKRVRLLALATAQRLSDLPDVPTVQELIHTPFEAAAWFVIMARAGTPADTLQKINAVTNRYLQSARGQELIAKQAVEAGGGTPADAEAFVKRELATWEPVIKAVEVQLIEQRFSTTSCVTKKGPFPARTEWTTC